MKRSLNGVPIKDYTDEEIIREFQATHEIIREFQATHEMIYVIDCFGTHDVYYCEALADELDKRGYDITEGTPRITKRESDEDEEQPLLEV